MKIIKYIIFFVFLNMTINADEFIIHKVADKETLYGISKKYNVKLIDILKLNDIKDQASIKTGTELKIPVNKTGSAEADKTKETALEQKKEEITAETKIISDTVDYEIYKFKKGDSLWQISRQYGINLKEILKINNITDTGNIKENSMIKIPKNYTANKSETVNADTNKEPGTSGNFKTHTIADKETLYKISKIYNTTADEICRINNITDVSKIKSGMVIKIPIKTTEPVIKQTTNNNGYILYTLKDSETLWRVSKNFKITVDKICQINNITDIKNLKKGSTIKIPATKNFIQYSLPVTGIVDTFKTSHFSGVSIYTDSEENKRNVTAIDDGVVSYVDNVPGFGLTVFIRHNNDYISTYSGFESINVKEGMKVKANDVIGKTGSLTRQYKYGILFSIQYKGNSLNFDEKNKKFIKNSY